ncbi:NTP transferase domain-containing protein [Neobacillus muris]|uniref:NTP transferase domain-containing protein n=1 Tax=Neobacillus muris TaxID=2941334 RepID=UPI00203C75E3|nr:NTP transferase domain-containing protein [Neobacillus muris]
MINSAIILAGGLSQRYGKNKLLETFNGKTLIEYNIDFCYFNNITDIHIVYYDEKVYAYLKNKFSKEIIMKNITLHKRPDEPVGTGMSLLTPINLISDRFIILFGDNFYKGRIEDNTDSYNVATYKYFSYDSSNLRFAAIQGDSIIEKPHSVFEGKYFVGYMILNRKDILSIPYSISGRGEVEITEIFNRCPRKQFRPLNIDWEEITYVEDYNKMLKLIMMNGD